MKDAQKPDRESLYRLIGKLREGQYVIPDFQREFEWEAQDIRELMRSVFLDYYIGSLLLWKGKKENFKALSCESVYGLDENERQRPEFIVLDGQQRLTAFYYAFTAPDTPLPNRTKRAYFFIRVDKFMNEEYDDAFDYAWSSQRFSDILETPATQYERHIFPLFVLGGSRKASFVWIDGYEKYWEELGNKAEKDGDDVSAHKAKMHAENAKKFGDHLHDIIEQYQVSYIELDQEIELDKVCDIFTQINSRGVRLDVFDLLNALLVPKKVELKKMWREAEPRLEFVDSDRMNVYILQTMSILEQTYCSPKYIYNLLPGQEKQIRDPDGARHKKILFADAESFKKKWSVSVNAIEQAISMLRNPQEFGAVSSKYLPYPSILPAFSALLAWTNAGPSERRFDAGQKIRLWYWSSVFTNRYDGAVDSTSARDFSDVRNWIEDDEREPALISEFKDRLHRLELRRVVRGAVYSGVFNLLVLNGARDWVTGNALSQPDDLDNHHIVPSTWGAKNLEGSLIHTILNRTPLTADTNRNVIGNNLPNVYLPKLIEENGEEEVSQILMLHFISPEACSILLRNPFTPNDFEEFLTQRQRTILEAIEGLIVKQRLLLPTDLRELDANIEKVELDLRKIVAIGLTHNPNLLPPHVQERVNDRIQRAAKKNAALDTDRLQLLDGKLEFCDLQELKDTILSKSLWLNFSSLFSNKETLDSKFNQLTELRNSIRHSRHVDDVTRKEGEAALIWFETVLKK